MSGVETTFVDLDKQIVDLDKQFEDMQEPFEEKTFVDLDKQAKFDEMSKENDVKLVETILKIPEGKDKFDEMSKEKKDTIEEMAGITDQDKWGFYNNMSVFELVKEHGKISSELQLIEDPELKANKITELVTILMVLAKKIAVVGIVVFGVASSVGGLSAGTLAAILIAMKRKKKQQARGYSVNRFANVGPRIASYNNVNASFNPMF
jgi:hypothetical protein